MTMSSMYAARIRWATDALARLIDRARSEGWIDGSAEAGTGAPTVNRTSFPPDWLQRQLGLSSAQNDALWLLACIENDPRAARLAQALAPMGCADFTIQLLQALVRAVGHRELTGTDLRQLAALGLIEMAVDQGLPMYRRWIRASDRFLDLAQGD